MTASLERGDIEGVMASYEPDARILFEPGTALSDEASVRQSFAALSGLGPKVAYAGHEVIVSGDIAVHLAPWQMTGRTPDCETVTQGGLSVAILRRQPDGSWRMVIDNPHGGRLLSE